MQYTAGARGHRR